MKNRRNVCAATEAGYLEYDGLEGKIKTGCPMTPLQTSRYCYNHATRVSKSEVQHKCTQSTETTREEGIVKVIISKKETRSGVYYQVYVAMYSYGVCT